MHEAARNHPDGGNVLDEIDPELAQEIGRDIEWAQEHDQARYPVPL